MGDGTVSEWRQLCSRWARARRLPRSEAIVPMTKCPHHELRVGLALHQIDELLRRSSAVATCPCVT